MAALSHTSPQVAASDIRTSRFATLVVGFLAAVSGVVPAAFLLLAM